MKIHHFRKRSKDRAEHKYIKSGNESIHEKTITYTPVDNFFYIISIVSYNVGTVETIKSIIKEAQTVFGSLNKVWKKYKIIF